MAQDPLLVDQVQIEPGSGDTLLIRRATGGSLEFVDAVVTGGITLQALAQIPITGVKTVGKSGAGAEHTTIQAALDCVPASAGPTEPYVILIGPGVYNETINVVRDWVYLVGLGGVVLEPVETTPNGPGAYHTLVIQADLGTIPKHTVLRNLVIRNYHDAYACVRIVGGAASEVGDTGILIDNCNLQASAGGGNRQVWATSMNTLEVRGGSFDGSSALSTVFVSECAKFALDGVSDVFGVQADYDTGDVLPVTSGSLYRLHGCADLGFASGLNPAISSTLIGAGSLALTDCGRIGKVRFGGDRSFLLEGASVDTLTLTDTAAAKLIGSSWTTLVAGATTTLEESIQRGTQAFVAETSKTITLPAEAPNANYTVALEVNAAPANDEVPFVTAKTTTGFTINFTTNQSLSVDWVVLRP